MSDADPGLDTREQALWEALGGDATDFETNGSAETVDVPKDLLRTILRRLSDLEQRVDHLEDGQSPVEDDEPLIETYARMAANGDDEGHSTSDRIAVVLHRDWEDIAWAMGDLEHRKFGVDTKTKATAKYQPSRLRYRLRERLGFDPESIQIYRGLKRLAELSGGEEKVDQRTNRVHIAGGLYEYREMATADGKDVKRVVWRARD